MHLKFYIIYRVAPNFGFGFGKFEIRPFFPNSAKFLAEFANATAVRSVSYLITDNN